MAKEKIHVGLEIGTTKVCAVVAECRRDGEIRLLGVGESPSRGVRKGEIIDFQNASKCVHDALADAEERSDHEIDSVWLGVTGSHLQSYNNRSSVSMPEETEITESEIADVEMEGKAITIPKENVILHSIVQRYFVDGQEGVVDPLGMLGTKLEAEYHIIHGVMTRIQNTIRCVKEFGIEVEEVVANSIASASVVLDEAQKQAGVAVIDIGGGVTDYVVFLDGAVRHSGVIAIGGDHITNDLCIGLRIPITRAEKLKIEEGSALMEGIAPGDRITLRNDTGFSGKEIDREMLNMIIHARVAELFTIVRKRIQERVPEHLLGAGVLLTGGCSMLRGIREVAETVFDAPVNLAHAHAVSGPTSAFENPQLSTCLGLVKYAQAVHSGMPTESFVEKITKIFNKKFGL